ncbi:uncharacterized protein LOC131604391 [Vicia villosa]|uniref:uncharacterized protein LOC131604391 n=1 Tax=Vicia villosa TaxID=3911 RepID=UPI00273CEC94|nr:uncharacterized protein LOC131604391 [Vicia villosa]
MDTDTINFNEATVTYTAFIQQYHDEYNESSKPPPHSKRKTSPVVVSDEDDKSPPRTRQAQKKKQKAATPSRKEKGSGSSKLTSPGDKVSSEESPLKGGSNAFVVESHNSSPDNILTKDDVGKSHVLSPVIEDAQPLATIIPSTAVEGSQSTDDSPPTHKSEKADQQCSSSNNAAGHPTGSEDTLSDQDVMEETSKLTTEVPRETTTFGTIVSPETTSTPAPTKPTPSELERLKQTDPLCFLKAMMDIDNTSPSEFKTSPVVQPESGHKEDTFVLLRQIKEKFFETNLVETLSKDPIKSHSLNQLLKKVDLLLVSKEVSEVIILLGSLIEQLQANILRKHNVDEQLTAKMASHNSSWKSAIDATKQGEALKLKYSKNQKAYDECEKSINSWKQEIKLLEEKIKEAESRKATLQQSSEQELTEVARLGIQHFEAAQKMVPEIDELKKQRALIELRMIE